MPIKDIIALVVVVTGILWAAALWHLAKYFTPRRETEQLKAALNGLGERTNDITERVQEVELKTSFADKTAEQILSALHTVTSKLELVLQTQARQESDLKHVFRTLDKTGQ